MAIRRTKRIAKACGRNFQSRPSSVWSLLQRIAFLYCSGIWMWWNESMNRPGGRDTYSKLYCAGEYPGALIKTRIQIQKTWGGAWTPTSRQLFQGPNFEEQDSNPSLLIINQLSFLEGPLCPPRFWVTSTHPPPSAHRPQGSPLPPLRRGFPCLFSEAIPFLYHPQWRERRSTAFPGVAPGCTSATWILVSFPTFLRLETSFLLSSGSQALSKSFCKMQSWAWPLICSLMFWDGLHFGWLWWPTNYIQSLPSTPSTHSRQSFPSFTEQKEVS